MGLSGLTWGGRAVGRTEGGQAGSAFVTCQPALPGHQAGVGSGLGPLGGFPGSGLGFFVLPGSCPWRGNIPSCPPAHLSPPRPSSPLQFPPPSLPPHPCLFPPQSGFFPTSSHDTMSPRHWAFAFFSLTLMRHVTQLVKKLFAILETWAQFLGQEDPLEKA